MHKLPQRNDDAEAYCIESFSYALTRN